MPRRAGRSGYARDGTDRPAHQPYIPPTTPPSISREAEAYERLFPRSQAPDGMVPCRICQTQVRAIPGHLVSDHPMVTLEAYAAEFAGAPLGVTPEEAAAAEGPPSSVTARQASRHPGGRDAALIELSVKPDERKGYREDVASLIGQGYPPSYQVASVAYLMVLARRARHDIETTSVVVGDAVVPGESLDLLDSLEKRIESQLRELEKARTAREKTKDDPTALVEEELDAAEQWVRARIGELVHSCPGCGMPLTIPELPHWAYERHESIVTGVSWPVWSRELWALVSVRRIPLHYMAYVLRTSPEALSITCHRRDQPWPTWISIEDEERQLRVLLDAQDAGQPMPPAQTTPSPETANVPDASDSEGRPEHQDSGSAPAAPEPGDPLADLPSGEQL